MKNGDASSEDKVVLNGHDEEHHYNQHNDILRPIDFEYSSYNYRFSLLPMNLFINHFIYQ